MTSPEFGELDDPLELNLAPPTPDLRCTQRSHELTGLGGQLHRGSVHAGDLLGQACVRPDPIVLYLPHVFGEGIDGVVQRLHQVRDLLADHGGVSPRGILVDRAQRLAQQRLVLP